MPRPSLLILIVEDDLHQQFIWRYLRKLGFNAHAIRILKSPSGRGSAEQWVRARFPIEVETCRRRQAGTKLIVLIDADIHTIHQRLEQLDQALGEAEAVAMNPADLVRLVPKRNIETWILCLNGETVDGEQDYKRTRDDWTDLVRPAVDTLHDWTRPNATLPPLCVASLRTGIPELRKLE